MPNLYHAAVHLSTEIRRFDVDESWRANTGPWFFSSADRNRWVRVEPVRRQLRASVGGVDRSPPVSSIGDCNEPNRASEGSRGVINIGDLGVLGELIWAISDAISESDARILHKPSDEMDVLIKAIWERNRPVDSAGSR